MHQTELHILIAEDDADDCEIIQQSFAKHEAFGRIDIVKNGRELLDYLKMKNRPIPDVILTDINMPILSGIEALKEIKADGKLRQIPAFVYSTTINPTYKVRCLELGTRGFLIKPHDLKGFDDIPKKILSLLAS